MINGRNRTEIQTRTDRLKSLKTLSFLGLRQWTPPVLCTWTVPAASQLPIHSSCIDNPLLCEGDRRPK